MDVVQLGRSGLRISHVCLGTMTFGREADEATSFVIMDHDTDQALQVVEQFVREASKRALSPAQLALAWVLAEPRISVPILGARSLEQITDSLKGAEAA